MWWLWGIRRELVEEEIFEDVPTQKVKLCVHKDICTSPRQYSMKCIFGQKDCYIKKFYDRYPNYQEMFVGSLK